MPKKKFSEQKKTLENVKLLLAEYHKCMLVRPTGFGKTWLLTELIRDYKKVLYLYPSAVVADTVVDRYYDIALEKDAGAGFESIDPETVELYEELKSRNEIGNCDLMTYAMLIRKPDAELEKMAKKYDLIICDEAHRLGGAKTKIAMETLFAKAKRKTDFVGATATPTRMDNFDVASHFYGDRMAYVYTMHDAVAAKLLKKPHYCYATYDFKKDVSDAFEQNGQDIKDEAVKAVIDAKAIELGNLFNIPNIVRQTCDEYAVDTDYMKFIIFFASKKHMQDKISDVERWFGEAYPKHKISTLRISSSSRVEKSNTDKLSLLSPRPKHIDLIACIDMLNVGYHVSNLTGIMMYRGTLSSTIFTQQLGRALSAGADGSAIVFDIVDNLHRKAVFELSVREPKKPGPKPKRELCPTLDNFVLDPDTNKIMAEKENGDLINTQYRLDPKTGRIIDRYGNHAPFEYDRDTGKIINTADLNSASRNSNKITADCLEATGHEAEYREIIAKSMAEPLVQRCKYALQLHFRSWCLAHDVPYPISDEDLNNIYGLDVQDFYDEFRKVIKANKIAYPLGDAKKLLSIGKDKNSTDVPLEICCEARGVSIEQMTSLIFDNAKPARK